MKHIYSKALLMLALLGSATSVSAQQSGAPNNKPQAIAPVLSQPSASFLTIGPSLQGDQAQEPKGAEFKAQPGIAGRLIYAFDTARYTPGGFAWPWESYLVLRQFGKSVTVGNAAINAPASYTVTTPHNNFLFEPQFSPDGQFILFKVGNPVDPPVNYHLCLWNLKTQHLQKGPDKDLSHRLIYWSPNSRYLAYIEGAVLLPGSGGWLPAKLHLYDAQTGQDHLVTSHEVLLGSVAWTLASTLLFSEVPSIEKQVKGDKTQANLTKPKLPSIYEVSAEPGEPKLLIQAGFRPAPSPDGKWLAFFGFSDPTKPADSATGPAQTPADASPIRKTLPLYLLLADHDGHNVKLIQREVGSLSQLRWTPDSRRLILLKRSFKGENTVAVRVAQYDVATATTRQLTDLEYKIRPGTDLSEDNPLFRPLQVSNDGKYLFFQLLQFEAMPNNGLLLKAVNLEDGTVSTLCRIGSVRGLDWHDESTPLAAQSAK